jgi:hypothetical protein
VAAALREQLGANVEVWRGRLEAAQSEAAADKAELECQLREALAGCRRGARQVGVCLLGCPPPRWECGRFFVPRLTTAACAGGGADGAGRYVA